LARKEFFLGAYDLVTLIQGLFLLLESLYLLVQVLFFLDETAFVTLNLRSSFAGIPLLLVSLPDELIFGLEQYLALLRLGLFYRFLRYTRRPLLSGRKLKSGVKPADHPSQEKTGKRKGYVQYSHPILLF
jgi:hypothetical protein